MLHLFLEEHMNELLGKFLCNFLLGTMLVTLGFTLGFAAAHEPSSYYTSDVNDKVDFTFEGE